MLSFPVLVVPSLLLLLLLASTPPPTWGKMFIPFRTTEAPPNAKMKMCGPDVDQAWVMIDDMDCSAYFTCNGHFYVYRKCPEQLHFDPIRGICDHPHIVRCVAKDK